MVLLRLYMIVEYIDDVWHRAFYEWHVFRGGCSFSDWQDILILAVLSLRLFKWELSNFDGKPL